ncbi:MAG: DegT/DnrJ/EryC1/StrS family aminotransferase, partial [Candidatus Limnocylindrales bacterium]
RCEIVELSAMALDRRWSLIEDACEGLGTTVEGRPLGSFGDISVYAFYPNKQITTGEGGVVLTDDAEVAEVLRSLRNQGRDQDGTWLRHVRLGFNYRLDELSAALGVAQMTRRSELAAGRARVAARYGERLRGIAGVTTPVAKPDTEVDWFVYVIRLADDIDRDQVMETLSAAGIPSRPYFSPIHLQPFYRDRFGYGPGDFPIAERVAAGTLALPFSSVLADAEVDHVAEQVRRAIHGG